MRPKQLLVRFLRWLVALLSAFLLWLDPPSCEVIEDTIPLLPPEARIVRGSRWRGRSRRR